MIETKKVIEKIEAALKDPQCSSSGSQMTLKKIRNELYRVWLGPGAKFSALVSFIAIDSPLDFKADYFQTYSSWLGENMTHEEYMRQRSRDAQHKAAMTTSDLIKLAEETKNAPLYQHEVFADALPLFDQISSELKRLD